jgi:hypothetical protein
MNKNANLFLNLVNKKFIDAVIKSMELMNTSEHAILSTDFNDAAVLRYFDSCIDGGNSGGADHPDMNWNKSVLDNIIDMLPCGYIVEIHSFLEADVIKIVRKSH